MKKDRIRLGIILEVAIIFIFGSMATGLFTYFTEDDFSQSSVMLQTETMAAEIAEETSEILRQYPAYQWLIRYWYEHADTMEIEYDADYSAGTETEMKYKEFSEKYPEIQTAYADERTIRALPEEDQKLYAEIIYSWLIKDVNHIKRSHNIDYLFCVITEEPYTDQFFLFSGAEEGDIRGTNYEEVYPLGVKVTVGESQQEAMRDAVNNSQYLAEAGDYMDYYADFCEVDGHKVLIGMTYNLSGLKELIQSETEKGAALAITMQNVLSVIYLIALFALILRPLRTIQNSIREYKNSKDSEKVRNELTKTIRFHNEIGELSEDVIDMTKEIDEHVDQIEKITAEREKVTAELELAARIQLSSLPNIFPPFPERNEFDIYALMDPAREVGGDLYDFFMVDDDHLALLIADVSGKGIPAALTMMMCLILIHSETKTGSSPAEVLNVVNNELYSRNPEQMFVSVWLGILQISTGKLKAANAGHEYPVIKGAKTKYKMLRDKHGFVLGGMEDLFYTEYELQLEPGSKVFVYTDGLPEATAADGTMFGNERILTSINEVQDADPGVTIDHMRGAVDAFVKDAEQFDDLTMLCLAYYGKDGKKPEES